MVPSACGLQEVRISSGGLYPDARFHINTPIHTPTLLHSHHFSPQCTTSRNTHHILHWRRRHAPPHGCCCSAQLGQVPSVAPLWRSRPQSRPSRGSGRATAGSRPDYRAERLTIAAVEPPPPACAAAAAHQRSGSVSAPRRRRSHRSSWPAARARSSAGVSEKKHSRLRCTQAAKNKKQCDACSSRRPRGTREFPRCSSSLTSSDHASASVLVATARVLCRVCFFAPSAHALECQRQ